MIFTYPKEKQYIGLALDLFSQEMGIKKAIEKKEGEKVILKDGEVSIENDIQKMFTYIQKLGIDEEKAVVIQHKEIKTWLKFADEMKNIGHFKRLNNQLSPNTFFLGHELSLLDFVVFAKVSELFEMMEKARVFEVCRWFNFFSSLRDWKGLKTSLVEIKPPAFKFSPFKEEKQKGKKGKKKDKKKAKPTPKADPLNPYQIDIRIGLVKEIEKHPNAEKLFIEKIDIGEEKPRTICSGLFGKIKKEDILGKKVLVMANLKPSKMVGVVSEGMLMVSTSPEHEYDLIILPDNCKVGDEITYEGAEKIEHAKTVNSKKLRKMVPNYKSNEKREVCFSNYVMKVNNGILLTKKPNSTVS